MTAQAAPLLNVEGIETFYGDSHILHEVSLEVADGEVVCLLGRHGAGKTTTLRSIMGLTPPRRGRLIYRGRDITRLPAFTIAQLGLGYVPEDRRIFPGLSVRDNLLVAARSATDGQAYTLERVFEDFPDLADLQHRAGRNLSGGQQQMLTIARTLMGNPRLLLLDEPTEGLAPIVVERIGEIIRRIIADRITVLLAEQNAAFALSHSQRAYVIDDGRVVWSGTVPELKSRRDLMERYLALSLAG
jgi:branched-chain amino acid transport system ATP-binding protein